MEIRITKNHNKHIKKSLNPYFWIVNMYNYTDILVLQFANEMHIYLQIHNAKLRSLQYNRMMYYGKWSISVL
jgi:hypothetical protein